MGLFTYREMAGAELTEPLLASYINITDQPTLSFPSTQSLALFQAINLLDLIWHKLSSSQRRLTPPFVRFCSLEEILLLSCFLPRPLITFLLSRGCLLSRNRRTRD